MALGKMTPGKVPKVTVYFVANERKKSNCMAWMKSWESVCSAEVSGWCKRFKSHHQGTICNNVQTELYVG